MPPVAHHSLLVETCPDGPVGSMRGGVLVAGPNANVCAGCAGGRVHRYREIVVFHGDLIYPEYLLAYQRTEPEPDT